MTIATRLASNNVTLFKLHATASPLRRRRFSRCGTSWMPSRSSCAAARANQSTSSLTGHLSQLACHIMGTSLQEHSRCVFARTPFAVLKEQGLTKADVQAETVPWAAHSSRHWWAGRAQQQSQTRRRMASKVTGLRNSARSGRQRRTCSLSSSYGVCGTAECQQGRRQLQSGAMYAAHQAA
jgi:hypothetical protein